MNILLTLFADVNDQGEFVLIWHGEDVTYHHQSMDDLQKRHHQSMDDLQKRLLASEQENSKLKTKLEKMRCFMDE
jgi:hypothetical protein